MINAEFATQSLGESDTDQNRNTIYQNAKLDLVLELEPRQSKISSWLAKRSPELLFGAMPMFDGSIHNHNSHG